MPVRVSQASAGIVMRFRASTNCECRTSWSFPLFCLHRASIPRPDPRSATRCGLRRVLSTPPLRQPRGARGSLTAEAALPPPQGLADSHGRPIDPGQVADGERPIMLAAGHRASTPISGTRSASTTNSTGWRPAVRGRMRWRRLFGTYSERKLPSRAANQGCITAPARTSSAAPLASGLSKLVGMAVTFAVVASLAALALMALSGSALLPPGLSDQALRVAPGRQVWRHSTDAGHYRRT